MIVITTPTGMIGSQVLQNVVSADAPVRIIIRDATKLPRELENSVEIIEGSHGDAETVDRAFNGADAVFWLTPPNPKARTVQEAFVDFTLPAAEAIKKHGVKRIVDVTALGRGTDWADKAGYATGSLAMDDVLAKTGANFRALTMPSFMDNIARQAQAIKEMGKFFSPISGAIKLPSVATRDIAATAAKYLLDDSWVGQNEVPVLGPEDISFDDMAEIMSDVLGKPVTFQQIPAEAYKSRFVEFGMSDAMAQGMLDMAIAKDHGLDKGVKRTPEYSTPTSFRTWCEDTLKPLVFA